MKLNDYLKDVYDLSHSEFEILSNDIQKSIYETLRKQGFFDIIYLLN